MRSHACYPWPADLQLICSGLELGTGAGGHTHMHGAYVSQINFVHCKRDILKDARVSPQRAHGQGHTGTRRSQQNHKYIRVLRLGRTTWIDRVKPKGALLLRRDWRR